MLVGLLRAPAQYDPFMNREAGAGAPQPGDPEPGRRQT